MSGPGPATVAAGAWRDIDVPSLGSLAPEATVAVVLHGEAIAVARTRAALLEQSYPADLIEVIEPGAGREPEADVILLLEAGIVPASRFVEAHARWHHAVADAVSFGPLAPADPALDDPLDLAIDLTRDFTDLAGGFHLVAAEGTIGVRRELYREAGGAGSAPSELRRLDLAYRLHCVGAVFVAEPEALASGGAPSLCDSITAAAAQGTTLELELPAAAGLIPLPPFRGPASSLRHARPAMAVNVAVGEAPAEKAVATVAGVLGGRFGDLDLRVQIDDAHPGRDAVAAAIAADARASFAGSSLEDPSDAPFQTTVPAATALDPRTLADLQELALGENAGALHVTVPGVAPQDAMIDVVSTAAWRRSQRLAGATGEPAGAILGRLFGERWVSGVEVSVRGHGIDEPQVTEHGPLAAATDLNHERNAHLRFRERAEDLAERAEALARRTLAERLRARAARRAAERIEERFAATRSD